jgi:hypothetical protein
MKKIINTCLVLLFAVSLASAQSGIGIPSLNSPDDGAENRMPNVNLNWAAVIGATGYHLLLATDADFNTLVLDTVTNLSAIQNKDILFNTTYFWKVRTVINENFSDWSETRNFTTFEKLLLDKPTNGTSNHEADVQFKWKKNIGGTSNPISGFEKFQIQISTHYNFDFYDRNFDGSANLSDVVLIDEATGWIVGENGTLLKIFNNKIHVDNAFSEVEAQLNAVAFLNEQHGFVAGTDGFVARYHENNWTVIEDSAIEDISFNTVHIFNDSVALFAGDAGHLAWLNGDTFENKYLEFYFQNDTIIDTIRPNIHSVSFIDSIGFAVGSSINDTIPGIFKYSGGMWSMYEDAQMGGHILNDLLIMEDSVIWACGEDGIILKVMNDSIVEIDTGLDYTESIHSVSHLNSNLIFTANDGQSLTFNMEQNEWKIMASSIVQDLTGSYIADNKLIMVGTSGTVLTFDPDILPFENPSWSIYKTFVEADNDTQNVSNMFFNEIYTWRMRAVHDQDESSWSDAWTFSNKNPILLDAPANNAAQQHLSFDISWKAFKGCTEYEYQVYPDESFGNAVTFITPELFAKVPNLFFGENYYWRVKGLNQRDTSDWSAVWSFSTPGSVTLVGPDDNMDSVELKPLLRWNQIKGIHCYNIQFSENEDFEGAESAYQETDDSQTEPSYRPFNFLNGKTEYFWRVRACTELDTSDFSPVWSFTTMSGVGISELFTDQNVAIFPNPASNNAVLNINISQPVKAIMQISDISAREVLSRELDLLAGSNNIDLNLQGYGKGVYFVAIRNDEGTFTTKLIIK